jgi:hypothetical protein
MANPIRKRVGPAAAHIYQPAGGGRELGTMANPGIATVIPPHEINQIGAGSNYSERAMFFIQDNLAFSIFILMFIPTFIYIFFAFFGVFSGGLNNWAFGVFKRPLPDNPALYFDVNCINSMNLEDFLETNQLQRCREMRNIDRPGPPRRF